MELTLWYIWRYVGCPDINLIDLMFVVFSAFIGRSKWVVANIQQDKHKILQGKRSNWRLVESGKAQKKYANYNLSWVELARVGGWKGLKFRIF